MRRESASCRYFEYKETVDWTARENDLKHVLDKHRRNDGRYDVLIPGSGGKDSIVLAHIIKKI